MKKPIFLFFLLSFALTALGQAPQSFQYQAVVRDAGGNPICSQPVGMRISLLQYSTSGTLVYQETHNPTSNGFGLVNLEIGMGSVVSGTFNTIDWNNGPYYIEVEFDPAGGTSYTVMGTSQLLSVPYALQSEKANCCITAAFYRGDTLVLTRADGTVLNVLQCGVTDLETGASATVSCIQNTVADNADEVSIAIDYTGLDQNAVIINNGAGTIGGDDPATTSTGTIILTGLTEGDDWSFIISGGLSGSCNLLSMGTVASDLCAPCGITDIETGTQAQITCLTNTPGNDNVTVKIDYVGVEPNAIITNNGSGIIGGNDPKTTPDGTIILTGLKEGDSWNFSITGGTNNICSLNSSGNVPGNLCIDPQTRLNAGETPCDLLDDGFTPNDLYGLTYQGGFIFYINNSGPGCAGLVSAPVSQSLAALWGCNGVPFGTGAGVGTGAQNTINILAGCSQSGIAAEWANQYTGGGYTDWFLPSKDELNLMYVNLRLNGKGNLGNFRYWSSSEFPTPGSTNVWSQGFAVGDQGASDRSFTLNHVRAVRAF
ncbi:MAG: DUF1566 domain-containing protein [Lewinellaceae bacterium]|nr:DUF1566 domain-containing protein [Lewinellaceae bacterium]